LEGIVSKRRDLPYGSGRSKVRIKVKNARWRSSLDEKPLQCLRFFGVFGMSAASQKGASRFSHRSSTR
jgi:hypothetical protein